MRKKELLLFIGVLILGAFFRFYLIQEIPPGLYPDEAANGNNAVEALRTGTFKVFYPENNGREGLFINLQAIAIWILGAEPWVLRVVSAFFGTLTILGIYLMVKELFSDKLQITNHKPQAISSGQNSKSKIRASNFGFRNLSLFGIWNLEFRISRGEVIGLFSAFFLATSYWHINFSRIGFRGILVPFFATFGMYWLLKGLRTGKISSTVLAGLLIGLGFHAYIAFRFMPFVLIIPLAIYFYRWWRSRKISGSIGYPIELEKNSCVPCIILLFLFITLVIALPIGFYFLQNPQDFFGRGGQVSILSGENPLYEFARSNLLTLRMFFWRGDCNPRHNMACQPQLFWPVAVFFAVGFILSIAEVLRWLKNPKSKILNPKQTRNPNNQNVKNNHPGFGLRISNLFRVSDLEFRVSQPTLTAFILLSWFAFMMLPATLTREGLPHALRSLGLIPPVILLAGWGAAFTWEKIKHYLETAEKDPLWIERKAQIGRIKKEVALLMALILILVTVNTYRTYFVRFPNRIDTQYAFSTELASIGRYLNTLPRETKKFVIVNPADVIIRNTYAPAQTPMFISDTFSEEKRAEKNVVYVRSIAEIGVPPKERAAIIPMNPDLTKELLKNFPEFRARIQDGFVLLEN